MALFTNFGQVWHTLPNGKQVLLNDITKYITIPEIYRTDSRLYLTYRVQDGDRPDLLSYRLYGTVEYQWTILIMNSITSMDEKWPRTEAQLEDYVTNKYPFNNIYQDIHHYEDENGLVQDPVAVQIAHGYNNTNEAIMYYGLVPVKYFDYEFRLNEAKRDIKLLDPEYIADVDRQVKEAFSG